MHQAGVAAGIAGFVVRHKKHPGDWTGVQLLECSSNGRGVYCGGRAGNYGLVASCVALRLPGLLMMTMVIDFPSAEAVILAV